MKREKSAIKKVTIDRGLVNGVATVKYIERIVRWKSLNPVSYLTPGLYSFKSWFNSFNKQMMSLIKIWRQSLTQTVIKIVFFLSFVFPMEGCYLLQLNYWPWKSQLTCFGLFWFLVCASHIWIFSDNQEIFRQLTIPGNLNYMMIPIPVN